nr:MAG: hypothetical protein H4Bulk473037_000002 [Mitovirus sp.]
MPRLLAVGIHAIIGHSAPLRVNTEVGFLDSWARDSLTPVRLSKFPNYVILFMGIRHKLVY